MTSRLMVDGSAAPALGACAKYHPAVVAAGPHWTPEEVAQVPSGITVVHIAEYWWQPGQFLDFERSYTADATSVAQWIVTRLKAGIFSNVIYAWMGNLFGGLNLLSGLSALGLYPAIHYALGVADQTGVEHEFSDDRLPPGGDGRHGIVRSRRRRGSLVSALTPDDRTDALIAGVIFAAWSLALVTVAGLLGGRDADLAWLAAACCSLFAAAEAWAAVHYRRGGKGGRSRTTDRGRANGRAVPPPGLGRAQETHVSLWHDNLPFPSHLAVEDNHDLVVELDDDRAVLVAPGLRRPSGFIDAELEDGWWE